MMPSSPRAMVRNDAALRRTLLGAGFLVLSTGYVIAAALSVFWASI